MEGFSLKKFIITTLCVTAIMSCFASCGIGYGRNNMRQNFNDGPKGSNVVSGNLHDGKMEFNVDDFDTITVGGAFDIDYTYGEAPSIVAEGKAKDLENIRVSTSNNNLYISYNKKIVNVSNIKLKISSYSLKDFDLDGAVKFKTTNTIKEDYLNLDIAGAGDISMDLEVNNLTVDIAGTSSIKFEGDAYSSIYSIAGAASVKAYDLESNDISIDIAGAGSANVNAKDTLDVSIAGAGSVKYKGHPEVTKDIAGVGTVSKKD